jgi:hypothetical protein
MSLNFAEGGDRAPEVASAQSVLAAELRRADHVAAGRDRATR